MKAYVQFTIKDQDLLGSDGVFVLDGRCKLQTWIDTAIQRATWLKPVQPHIDGIKIMVGNRFDNSRCIHSQSIKE